MQVSLISMCGLTRIDKVKNDYIRKSLNVEPVDEKLRKRLTWLRHEMHGDEKNVVKIDLSMEVAGYKSEVNKKKMDGLCKRGYVQEGSKQ